MTETILVKVQTADRFGVVLQSSQESEKLPTLAAYGQAGWEIVSVTAEGAAKSALVVLRKVT